MLPEAWKEELSFTCSSTSCWEKFFTGMVWCKSVFLVFSLDFAMYSVTVGCSWHWLFCSVMHKSCFHFLCTRANCSCLSVPHSGFTRHRERISNALMVFKSGCIYLFMKCKHPTVVCSTSFKTLLSVCCVVQFRGTCKCSVGQLCCSDDVCLPLKSVRYLVNPAAGAGHKQCVSGREAA